MGGMGKHREQPRDAAPAPSAWVVRHGARIPDGGRILDVACGKGRHVRHFLALGHPVTAIDRDTSGLSEELAAMAAGARLEIIEADLEDPAGAWPTGAARFAGVVVTNYLWRPLLPAIVAAVAPGGVLIYETFAEGNQRFGKPGNPDYLLRPGELLAAVGTGFEVADYQHGEVTEPRPAVIQRICAERVAWRFYLNGKAPRAR